MINRRDLLLLAAGSAAATRVSGAVSNRRPPLRRGASRAEEVRALRRFAEETHPRGREARDDRAWGKTWSQLESTADNLSDGAYFVETRRVLSWFEDGHTTVLPFEYLGKIPNAFASGPFGLQLPWKVRVFDDGAYVVAVTTSCSALLGSRVEQVGPLMSAAFMNALDESWPGNRAWTQNWAGLSFASVGQLEGLGVIGHGASLPVHLSGTGSPDRVSLRAVRTSTKLPLALSRSKSPPELWAAAAARRNYVKQLPEAQTIYVSMDEMDDLEEATFEKFSKEVIAAMQSSPEARLVLDLRRNGGGNNYLAEPLRKHIERSAFNEPGRLFVLVGPATFSAAQNFVNRLERETFAIFVGGPTGLSPNHYGDAKLFTGNASGLVAMVSTLPWFDSYPQDKRVWIMPDLPVAYTFEDWCSGRDPVLERALSYSRQHPIDEFADDRTFYFSRPSQKAAWKSFWV